MTEFIPESLIWELMKSNDANIPEFIDFKIYKHRKNFDNNGDKYLVVLKAESQNFLFSSNYADYNSTNYDLLPGREYEKETLAFIIVGNIEIDSFIKAFKK